MKLSISISVTLPFFPVAFFRGAHVRGDFKATTLTSFFLKQLASVGASWRDFGRWTQAGMWDHVLIEIYIYIYKSFIRLTISNVD